MGFSSNRFQCLAFFCLWLGFAAAASALDCAPLVGDDPMLVNLTAREKALFPDEPRNLTLADNIRTALWRTEMDYRAVSTEFLQDPRLARNVLNESYVMYRRGLISRNQLVTLVMRWQIETDLGPYAHEIRSKYLIDRTGKFTQVGRELIENGDRHALTEGQALAFRQELLASPLSEQTAYEIVVPPAIFNSAGPGHPHLELLRVLLLNGPTRVFGLGERTRVLIPSFSGLQALLNARFGVDAVQLAPEFDAAPSESILARSESSVRPFGLGYPGLTRPEVVDNVTSAWLGFSFHDWHHAATASDVPRAYRRLFVRGYALITEALKGGGWRGRYRLAPGTYLSLHKATTHYPVEHYHNCAVDMAPHSRILGRFTPTQNSFGHYLLQDFGPLSVGWSGLFVKDMAENPDWYRGIGVDPVRLTSELGEEAIQMGRRLNPSGR